MMRKLIVLLAALLLLIACGTNGAAAAPEAGDVSMSQDSSSESEAGEISGYLKDGLRYLPVPGDNAELIVYRGDYVLFELTGNDSVVFSVPDLGIDVELPKPAEEKPYVKIKESGVYPFSLGERSGVLTVKELEASGYTELTAEEALSLIESTSPLILDVRTPGEYESARIPGAVLLPVQVLEQNLAQLEPYKDEVIFVYCASGNRSTVASRIMLEEGFTRLYNLRRGIGDWASKGLPTVSGE